MMSAGLLFLYSTLYFCLLVTHRNLLALPPHPQKGSRIVRLFLPLVRCAAIWLAIASGVAEYHGSLSS
jgi:hypothetical protein